MKIATFTVRADVRQSARWKQAAEAEGFASVGSWLAGAADAYLKEQARAGRPLPLAWRRAHFTVRLEDATEMKLRGQAAPPFFFYRGTAVEPRTSRHAYTLVFQPTGRILATLRRAALCRTLAAELARSWVRWGGEEPSQDPAPLLQRFQRDEA